MTPTKENLTDWACFLLFVGFLAVTGRALWDCIAYGRYGPITSIGAVFFAWVVLTVWAKMEEENL